MRRLLPEGPDVTDLTTLEGLAEAYAYPEATDRGVPWLRANMVSSLDGAARLDGLSEGLSSEADKRIFGVLRALADVVVVAAATIAVVSTRLDLDLDAPLFTEPLTPTLVITCAAAPAAALKAAEQAAEVVLAGDERVDPVALVRVLAERGWTRLLTEGGPSLLGQLAAAGVLDELCLSLAPLLAAGDAPRISHGPTAAAGRMELVSLLEEKGFLFARYARSVKSAG
jgi:riboflavin biosynthesis pyrimidine reductase